MSTNQREIKIIAKFSAEEPITPPNVTVYLDDEPVGVIQDIKFHATVNEPFCKLEVTFPDLHSKKIAKSYFSGPNLVSSVDYWVNKLKSIVGIKVKIKDIFKDL